MLEAQRRLADAESRHFQSLTEYAIAIKNVHYAKGTLLDYDGVVLNESGWPAKAYADAAERDALRGKPRPLNYASARAPIVSDGPYAQQAIESELPLGTELIESEPIQAAPVEGDAIQPLPVETVESGVAKTQALLQPMSVAPAAHETLVNPAEQAASAETGAISADLASALEAAAAR
jgi:hypothetical protein